MKQILSILPILAFLGSTTTADLVLCQDKTWNHNSGANIAVLKSYTSYEANSKPYEYLKEQCRKGLNGQFEPFYIESDRDMPQLPAAFISEDVLLTPDYLCLSYLIKAPDSNAEAISHYPYKFQEDVIVSFMDKLKPIPSPRPDSAAPYVLCQDLNFETKGALIAVPAPDIHTYDEIEDEDWTEKWYYLYDECREWLNGVFWPCCGRDRDPRDKIGVDEGQLPLYFAGDHPDSGADIEVYVAEYEDGYRFRAYRGWFASLEVAMYQPDHGKIKCE